MFLLGVEVFAILLRDLACALALIGPEDLLRLEERRGVLIVERALHVRSGGALIPFGCAAGARVPGARPAPALVTFTDLLGTI